MQPLQRAALRSARRIRPTVQSQPRRYAGDSHGGHGHGHSQQPVNESFGSGFYISLAAIPASIALYQFTRQNTDEQPWATRYIHDTYTNLAEKWARRNDTHTQAMEQAAADRVLFLNEATQSVRTVDLRFPEQVHQYHPGQFNFGAPWNVPAGNGSANVDRVIAKYEKEAYEENARKLQQLRDNNVPAEQPLPGLTKSSPATPSA